MRLRPLPLTSLALLAPAVPALAQDGSTPVDPLSEDRVTEAPARPEGPWLPHDVDGAQPGVPGKQFFSPVDMSYLQTRTDDEWAATPRATRVEDQFARPMYLQEEDGLWVRGRTFKARANAEGFTYIPFFGSRASQNWPIEMRLARVTNGAAEVPFLGKAEVVRHGDTLHLERGAVDADYHVATGAVEQTFTIDAPFAAADLVVTLDLITELGVTPDGEGFRFSGPDGDVGYGAAIAFDGAGARTAVETAIDGETIVLTVPASFVQAAEGPITIDPVIETYTVDTTNNDQTDCDVAYDLTSDTFIYVFEDTFSSTDPDLYYRRLEPDGTQASAGWINLSADLWRDPSIANLNHADSCLVVAVRETVGGPEIVGRILDITDNSVDPVLVIGNTSNVPGGTTWDNENPDVGGNSSTATSSVFMVVWTREFEDGDSFPRYRTVSATGVLGNVRAAETGNDINYREVVISESTGNPSTVNLWNVVYREDDSNGDEQIRGFQLDAAGGVATPPDTIRDVGSTERIRDLDVSDGLDLEGLDPTYIVAYDDFEPSLADVEILVCRGTNLRSVVDLNRQEHAIETRNQDLTHIGTSRADFVVSYMERDGGVWIPYVSTLDLTYLDLVGVSERRTPLGDGWSNMNGGAKIASRFSGGNIFSRWSGIGFSVETAGTTNGFDVLGVTHSADQPYAPAFQYCDGEPNSTGDRGFLTLYGNRNTTSTKTLTASGCPPMQFSLLVVGTNSDLVPNVGGGEGTLCVGGNLGRYTSQITQFDADGQASFSVDPTAIPSGIAITPAMSGDFLRWQLWHRDFNGAQTSNLTNAVLLRFD